MNKINIENYNDLKSWPFKEAQQILKRNGGLANFKIPKKGHILLETGYGPSGLPHIGTFGEVVRTTMVRNALTALIDCPTKMVTFSSFSAQVDMSRLPQTILLDIVSTKSF